MASHEQALKRYEEARTLYIAAGNRQGEGVAHEHLGKSYRDTGQLTLAEEAHRAALVIGREVGAELQRGRAVLGQR